MIPTDEILNMTKKMNSPWFTTHAADGTYTVRDVDGYPLAHGADEEDADFIVQAVNAHEGLVEALQLAVKQNRHDMVMTGEELRKCEAALAKAQGDGK